MLEFNIKNQTISRVDRFNPATDSVDYLTAKFNFLTTDWDGVTKKALFRSGTVSYEAAINASGVCNVPWEVLVSPENKFSALSGGCIKIFVSVLGTSGTIQIPTKECRVEIGASGLNETLNGAAPTPNIYEQFVDTIKADNDTTVAEIKADNDETRGEVEALTERAETAQTSAEQSAASMKNDYANALKGKVSGEVVRVDDVSPVEHNPVVKVKSKNLVNLNNILRIVNADVRYTEPQLVIKRTSMTGGWTNVYVELGNYNDFVGKTLTASLENLNEYRWTIFFTVLDGENQHLGDISSGVVEIGTNKITSIIPARNGAEKLAIRIVSSDVTISNDEYILKNIQVEVGDTATEYTPYIDTSTVTLTRCGKNLINSANFATYHAGRFSHISLLESTEDGKSITIKGDDGASGNANSSGWLVLNYGELINLKLGDEVTISADVTLVQEGIYGNNIKFAIINSTTGGTYASPKFTIGEKSRYTTTRAAQADGIHRVVVMVNANTIKLENIMVSVNGEIEYEDYNGTTYTPAADGTCDIVSVNPTMTLFTDTEGVTVDLEYNRDINKVIADLYNKLNG